MKFTKSIEDYLEAIHLLDKEKGEVKVNDIAANLDVKLPSVTQMIRKLSDKGLVSYKSYGPIELTQKGREIAKNVYSRHQLLAEFFISVGVDQKTALKDACLAEHALSKKTIDKLKIFVKIKE